MRITRWPIMQKVRGSTLIIVRPLLVNKRFHVLFHSPSGVLFTFPSRYLFTIGHQRYLVLESGLPGFLLNFSCSVVLGNNLQRSFAFRLQDYHLLWLNFPVHSAKQKYLLCGRFLALPKVSHNTPYTTPKSFNIHEVWTAPLSLTTT